MTNPPSVEAQALVSLVERFGGRRIVVLGDVMLDHFVFGRVQRISPEAPVPVVEFDHEQYRLGGAANVAHNLAAYGADVLLVGIIGEDEAASQVEQELSALGLQTGGLVRSAQRRTTRKMRIVTTRNQQVARVDYEQDADVVGDLEAQMVERAIAALTGTAVVVVSDYLKGAVTARLMATLTAEAARQETAVLVDPKIPHIDYYRGATLVTPNHHETEVATMRRIRTDAEARAAARAFRLRAGCASVLVTRGEHGMWLLEGQAAAVDPGDGIVSEFALEALAREVADVTGAGDTVIATVGLALASGATLPEAAALANHAAGISVAKFGPATVTPQELIAALAAS